MRLGTIHLRREQIFSYDILSNSKLIKEKAI